jgi:hypothetical protein
VNKFSLHSLPQTLLPISYSSPPCLLKPPPTSCHLYSGLCSICRMPANGWEGCSVCMVGIRQPTDFSSVYVCSLFFLTLLWSSGQSSWLQIHRSQVRFLVLPDFLRSTGSVAGSTRPRGDPLHSLRDYSQKLALTSPTSCGHLVGVRPKATEFSLVLL